MCRQHVVIIMIAGTFMMSCGSRYSYGVGFKSCTDGLLHIDVTSSTYSGPIPLDLRNGQMKAEDAIAVPLPPSMKLMWNIDGKPSNVATYQISGRLPAEFDTRRDTLWFIGCPTGEPKLVAEIGSTERGFLLHELSSGRRWIGKSIYDGCEVCSSAVGAP